MLDTYVSVELLPDDLDTHYAVTMLIYACVAQRWLVLPSHKSYYGYTHLQPTLQTGTLSCASSVTASVMEEQKVPIYLSHYNVLDTYVSVELLPDDLDTHYAVTMLIYACVAQRWLVLPSPGIKSYYGYTHLQPTLKLEAKLCFISDCLGYGRTKKSQFI